jgi:hypothetical protein
MFANNNARNVIAGGYQNTEYFCFKLSFNFKRHTGTAEVLLNPMAGIACFFNALAAIFFGASADAAFLVLHGLILLVTLRYAVLRYHPGNDALRVRLRTWGTIAPLPFRCIR